MKIDKAISRIRAERGLAARIAEQIGIDRSAVYQWERVPVKRVHVVAGILKMKPKEVREDIFGSQGWRSHGQPKRTPKQSGLRKPARARVKSRAH